MKPILYILLLILVAAICTGVYFAGKLFNINWEFVLAWLGGFNLVFYIVAGTIWLRMYLKNTFGEANVQ
jgi:hypothetical protein